MIQSLILIAVLLITLTMGQLRRLGDIANRSLDQSQFVLDITPIPWVPPSIPTKIGI